MKIVFVFALFAGAYALGSNKCTWGPSYWCSDVNAANECNALSFCQGLLLGSTDEKKTEATPGECKLCMLAINELDGKLSKNSTVEDIEKALDGVCSKFGAFKAPCEALVQKYTPELIATLITDLNATSVCKKIHLCNEATLSIAAQDTIAFASNIAMNKDLLGSNPCTEGPAYWCSTLLAAQKCKAEMYCKKGPWKKTGVPSA